jgi:excisionase family DNA binding protein
MDIGERKAYTPKEIARIMGRPERTIHKWLRENRIEGGERIGRNWLIWKDKFDAGRTDDRKQQAA